METYTLDLHTPMLDLYNPIQSIYTESIKSPLESLSFNLGRYAAKSKRYLTSKAGRKKALHLFIISEIIISIISIISLMIAGFYLPAALTALMTAYLIYASTGVY